MDVFYFNFNLLLIQWFRWQVAKHRVRKRTCNRWVQTTFDYAQWDIIGDIDTLNCTDFPIQLKTLMTLLFSPVLFLFFYETICTVKKILVTYKSHTCIHAVFLKEIHLDICHLQRHQNNGQLMITGYAGPPYTVVQLVHRTSEPSQGEK